MFLAMNRFRIARGQEDAFIAIWRERNSYLEQVSFLQNPGPRDDFLPDGQEEEGVGGHFWHDAVTTPSSIRPRHGCYLARTDHATLERDPG